MNLGAEPKKVAILIGLLVVALFVFLSNSSDSGPGPTAPASQRPTNPTARPTTAATQPAAAKPVARAPRGQRTLQEFRPSLKRRSDDRIDPMTVDPALKVDVIARLQNVTVEGNHRSIFEFSTPPPPKPAEAAKAKPAKPVPDPVVESKPAETETASSPPPKPPPPPIPLKFYGYISPSAQTKRAFFLEGEEIHVVAEGDLVKRRYKIVRIGINSVVVEDTEHKHQQTLPLEEQPG